MQLPSLKVDKYALDDACVQQVDLMEAYTRHLAEAKAQLQENLAELEMVKATVATDVRKDPARYSVVKVTEGAVANAIARSSSVRTISKLVAEQKKTVNLLDGFITALEHRKKMLENLVFLHGQGYFAAPSTRKAEEQGKRPVLRKS